jgi:tetratricopeptide (TPR) repeat protein
MQETVDQVNTFLKPNWTQFHIATPIVGTPMYDSFVEADCIEDGPSSWMKTLTNARYFDSPWIKKDEMNEFRYKANLECNFVKNYDLNTKNYKNAVTLFSAVAKLYPFQIYALNGLISAHKGLGNYKEAEKLEKQIKEVVYTDPRARDHLIKYGYMFPEVTKMFYHDNKLIDLCDTQSISLESNPETMITWLDTLDKEKYKDRKLERTNNV